MKAQNNNIRKNGSGYTDETAYKAIESVTKHASDRNKEIHQVITLIKNMANQFDLEIANRIYIKDLKTGKVHK